MRGIFRHIVIYFQSLSPFTRRIVSAFNFRLSVFAFLLSAFSSTMAQETEKIYLSGTGNDHTVQWDFRVSAGMNSGKWSKIAVPSNWELQGFGKYDYGFAKDILGLVELTKRSLAVNMTNNPHHTLLCRGTPLMYLCYSRPSSRTRTALINHLLNRRQDINATAWRSWLARVC